MSSRSLSSFRTITGAFIAALTLSSACSSGDTPGATVDGDGRPVLDTNGGGTIFDGVGVAVGAAGAGVGSAFDSSEACVGQAAGTELAPAILELLVDTSLSMDQNAPGSSRSKWVETRRALLDSIDLMPPTTSIGVVFYPDVETGADTCFDREADVRARPLGNGRSQQREELREAFGRESPRGSTPTHDAYRFALDELAEIEGVGQRFLVLITDGTPTYALDCRGSGTPQDPADPAPLIPEAAGALARGLKTFVIGSPGSEGARRSLSQMAQAGGTGSPGCSHDGQPHYCHFDMTEEADFARGLRDALASISGLALSCSYDIPEPPSGGILDPSKVNVLFTPPGGAREVIGQSPAGTCSDGWQYSSDQSQVLLCGPTCERVKASNGQLALEFGCSTRIIF